MSALVSIIMPALNAEKYIAASINSVLEQSYQKWELLIINNGSIDRTEQIISEYKDERIRLLNERRRGTSHARNTGLENALGAFVCFLDADDLMPPKSLEYRINLLETTTNCNIADGRVTYYDANTKQEQGSFQPVPPTDSKKEMARLSPCCFSTVSWMLRASAIEGKKFPEGWSHFEDRIFFGNIIRDNTYMCTQEVVYAYRRHPNSSMSSLDALDHSYQRFLKEIQPIHLSKEECRVEQKIYHSTFFKTYLKKMRIRKACIHLLKMLI